MPLNISCTSLPSLSTTFAGSFCLTTHALLWCVRTLVCGSEHVNASLPLRPSLAQIEVECEFEKKKMEKRGTSACLTPSIMTAPSLPHHSFPPRSHFIATHLSPCHHICIHPPANYTAPFPQTTLISNDVFSACIGIGNINGG